MNNFHSLLTAVAATIALASTAFSEEHFISRELQLSKHCTDNIILDLRSFTPLPRNRIYDLSDLFSAQGITFPEGASITIDPIKSILNVRNTEDRLELVQILLHEYSAPQSHPTISLERALQIAKEYVSANAVDLSKYYLDSVHRISVLEDVWSIHWQGDQSDYLVQVHPDGQVTGHFRTR